MSIRFLALASAMALLAACETAPTDGSADGSTGGGRGGSGYGSDGATSAAQRELEQVGDRVFFAYNSAVLTSEGQQTLQRQAGWLQQQGGVNIVVEGHCDERGTREYNLALGERRASSARNYLVSLGIAPSRVTTVSYGKERPAVVGSSDSAWAQNRRAVTVITSY